LLITQETSSQYLTLFDGTAAIVTEKPKREVTVICKPEMKSVTVLLLIVYEWGRLRVPNTHNSAPTTTPTNSISVNPADFEINRKYLNQLATHAQNLIALHCPSCLTRNRCAYSDCKVQLTISAKLILLQQ
jgi:hypothetical protein